MKGFNCLRALYIFEQANKLDYEADLILKSDNGREILSRGYRQYSSYLRSQADEVEAEYNENKKKKILIK